ncbi:hypothetical protein CLF_110980 [Clonorchis sinensis]|uniref:Uncharacterized protein n=1 Tax=Clonorchis sinensis TaxID=79923 RepID=G7YU54_CLOSI|nr:hypothetical protein CLF_110980 [Clonorchis sinensis]
MKYTDDIALLRSHTLEVQIILHNLNNSDAQLGTRLTPIKCKMLLQGLVESNPNLVLADELKNVAGLGTVNYRRTGKDGTTLSIQDQHNRTTQLCKMARLDKNHYEAQSQKLPPRQNSSIFEEHMGISVQQSRWYLGLGIAIGVSVLFIVLCTPFVYISLDAAVVAISGNSNTGVTIGLEEAIKEAFAGTISFLQNLPIQGSAVTSSLLESVQTDLVENLHILIRNILEQLLKSYGARLLIDQVGQLRTDVDTLQNVTSFVAQSQQGTLADISYLQGKVVGYKNVLNRAFETLCPKVTSPGAATQCTTLKADLQQWHTDFSASTILVDPSITLSEVTAIFGVNVTQLLGEFDRLEAELDRKANEVVAQVVFSSALIEAPNHTNNVSDIGCALKVVSDYRSEQHQLFVLVLEDEAKKIQNLTSWDVDVAPVERLLNNIPVMELSLKGITRNRQSKKDCYVADIIANVFNMSQPVGGRCLTGITLLASPNIRSVVPNRPAILQPLRFSLQVLQIEGQFNLTEQFQALKQLWDEINTNIGEPAVRSVNQISPTVISIVHSTGMAVAGLGYLFLIICTLALLVIIVYIILLATEAYERDLLIRLPYADVARTPSSSTWTIPCNDIMWGIRSGLLRKSAKTVFTSLRSLVVRLSISDELPGSLVAFVHALGKEHCMNSKNIPNSHHPFTDSTPVPRSGLKIYKYRLREQSFALSDHSYYVTVVNVSRRLEWTDIIDLQQVTIGTRGIPGKSLLMSSHSDKRYGNQPWPENITVVDATFMQYLYDSTFKHAFICIYSLIVIRKDLMEEHCYENTMSAYASIPHTFPPSTHHIKCGIILSAILCSTIPLVVLVGGATILLTSVGSNEACRYSIDPSGLKMTDEALNLYIRYIWSDLITNQSIDPSILDLLNLPTPKDVVDGLLVKCKQTGSNPQPGLLPSVGVDQLVNVTAVIEQPRLQQSIDEAEKLLSSAKNAADISSAVLSLIVQTRITSEWSSEMAFRRSHKLGIQRILDVCLHRSAFRRLSMWFFALQTCYKISEVFRLTFHVSFSMNYATPLTWSKTQNTLVTEILQFDFASFIPGNVDELFATITNITSYLDNSDYTASITELRESMSNSTWISDYTDKLSLFITPYLNQYSEALTIRTTVEAIQSELKKAEEVNTQIRQLIQAFEILQLYRNFTIQLRQMEQSLNDLIQSRTDDWHSKAIKHINSGNEARNQLRLKGIKNRFLSAKFSVRLEVLQENSIVIIQTVVHAHIMYDYIVYLEEHTGDPSAQAIVQSLQMLHQQRHFQLVRFSTLTANKVEFLKYIEWDIFLTSTFDRVQERLEPSSSIRWNYDVSRFSSSAGFSKSARAREDDWRANHADDLPLVAKELSVARCPEGYLFANLSFASVDFSVLLYHYAIRTTSSTATHWCLTSSQPCHFNWISVQIVAVLTESPDLDKRTIMVLSQSLWLKNLTAEHYNNHNTVRVAYISKEHVITHVPTHNLEDQEVALVLKNPASLEAPIRPTYRENVGITLRNLTQLLNVTTSRFTKDVITCGNVNTIAVSVVGATCGNDGIISRLGGFCFTLLLLIEYWQAVLSEEITILAGVFDMDLGLCKVLAPDNWLRFETDLPVNSGSPIRGLNTAGKPQLSWGASVDYSPRVQLADFLGLRGLILQVVQIMKIASEYPEPTKNSEFHRNRFRNVTGPIGHSSRRSLSTNDARVFILVLDAMPIIVDWPALSKPKIGFKYHDVPFRLRKKAGRLRFVFSRAAGRTQFSTQLSEKQTFVEAQMGEGADKEKKLNECTRKQTIRYALLTKSLKALRQPMTGYAILRTHQIPGIRSFLEHLFRTKGERALKSERLLIDVKTNNALFTKVLNDSPAFQILRHNCTVSSYCRKNIFIELGGIGLIRPMSHAQVNNFNYLIWLRTMADHR